MRDHTTAFQVARGVIRPLKQETEVTKPEHVPAQPVKGKLSAACRRGKPRECFVLSCSNPEHRA